MSFEVRHRGDLLSVRSTSNGKSQNPKYLMVGYLVSGYLDSGKNNLLLHSHSEILCGAALPGFFSQEKQIPGVLQPEAVSFSSA